MDYDKTSLPAVYDRARSRSPKVLELWMSAVARRIPAGASPTILDLGCGTGRFTGPLNASFSGPVLGVDPSLKMLGHARSKPEARRIRYLASKGEAIPLRDSSVDLIFMSMVFHHFADPRRVARECYRVLKPSGRVFLRAGIAESIPSYPITPFFPGAVPIMERTLAPGAAIEEIFLSAGFVSLERGALRQEIAETHALYADQLEAGADSVLIQLPASEFAAGLRALRQRAAEIDPTPVSELIDFLWFARKA